MIAETLGGAGELHLPVRRGANLRAYRRAKVDPRM
jgi:hypothetical protein